MNQSELALFSPPWLQLSLFQLPIMPERSPSEACNAPRSSPQPKPKHATCARTHTVVTMIATVADNGAVIGEDHWNAKYLDSDIEHAIELRQEGYTFREISLMLDMPIRTIRSYVDGSRRCQSVAGWKKIKRSV